MIWRSIFPILAIGALASASGFGGTTSASETLGRYLRGQQTSCRLEGHAMEMEIQASLPKLKKQGTMDGLKVISASGQVAYRFLRFTGDRLIKTDVIARFLTAEAQPPERLGNIGTTLQNYKFRFLRTENYQGAEAYVFELRPRKKRVGLFKGELWLDGVSAAPLREAGELVKSPSIFIQRVRFVRDYPGRDLTNATCGPPHRTAISVQTRLVGNAEMVVWQHPVANTWQPPGAQNPVDVTAR